MMLIMIPITMKITLSGSELDTCWANLAPPMLPYTTYQYYVKQYMWSRSMTKRLAGGGRWHGCHWAMKHTVQGESVARQAFQLPLVSCLIAG